MASRENVYVPRTEAGKAIDQGMDGGESANVRAYGGTVTDNSSHVDEWSLSRSEQERFGIGDHETIVGGARESVMPRRLAQLARKYGEARPARDIKTGEDPCAHMDAQMVIIPKAAYEAVQKQREKAARDYEAQFKLNETGEYEKRADLFDPEEQNYRMRRAANKERFRKAGIGEGSETAGMTFEEGLSYYARTGRNPEVLAQQAMNNGRHSRDSQAQWKQVMSGGNSFAVKANFAPKVNPNSALGQIQARNKGK
jgi:tRNA(Leu) C34 or U34 (ribose-2'-O)-methylase TrmL